MSERLNCVVNRRTQGKRHSSCHWCTS